MADQDMQAIIETVLTCAPAARQMMDASFEVTFGEALAALRTVGVEDRDVTRMRRVMRWTYDEGMISVARGQLGAEAIKLVALGRPDVLEDMAERLKLIAHAARTLNESSDRG